MKQKCSVLKFSDASLKLNSWTVKHKQIHFFRWANLLNMKFRSSNNWDWIEDKYRQRNLSKRRKDKRASHEADLSKLWNTYSVMTLLCWLLSHIKASSFNIWGIAILVSSYTWKIKSRNAEILVSKVWIQENNQRWVLILTL